MGHHDTRFPTNLSVGSSFGPGYNTSLIDLKSGAIEALSRWGGAGRRRYNLAYAIRRQEDLYTANEFFIARNGAANTWRLKDLTDYATTPTGTTDLPPDVAVSNSDVTLGTGDGATTQFQLFKSYTSGSQTVNRTIELPIASTVLVAVDGVLQTQGAAYTVNETTGLITFTTAPANTLSVTAGFQFDVKVRFGQATDLGFMMNLDTQFEIGSLSDIEAIEELPGGLADPEMAWHGGAKDHGTISANFTMTLAQGRAHRVSPTANIKAFLPSLLTIADGGPVFLIKNAGGANTVEVLYDDQTTSIVTLAAGAIAVFWIVLGAGGIKEWQNI